MACGKLEISDAELRDRLRQLGVSPGPITETTRGLYQNKLWNLTQTSKTKSRPKTPPLDRSSCSTSRPARSTGDAGRERSDSSRSHLQRPRPNADHTSSQPPSQPEPLTNGVISSPATPATTSTLKEPQMPHPQPLTPQMMAANKGIFFHYWKFLWGMPVLVCISMSFLYNYVHTSYWLINFRYM